MTPKSQAAAGKLVFNNWARPIILQQHVVQFFGIFWDWLLLLTIVTVVAMGPSNIITFCVSCFYLAFNAHISNNILDREWHCLLVVQCMVALLLFQLPNQWKKKKVSKDIGMCSLWRERETVKFFPTFSRSIAMKKCNLVVKRLSILFLDSGLITLSLYISWLLFVRTIWYNR